MNPSSGPPDPPEYNVYRARKKPLPRGGDLNALKRRLSRSRGDDGRARRATASAASLPGAS